MPVFLGLDCGGSTCRSLAIDEADKALFSGQSGPANLASTPAKILERNLDRALEECPPPDMVCGCFAGLMTERDRERAVSILGTRFPSARIRAEADYAAAYMASEPGVHACISAGTGSVIVSRIGGAFVKAGGRGHLLGDYGSAFRFGQAAARRFIDAGASGSSPGLLEAIRDRFETLDESSVVAKVYRAVSPTASLARLAPAFAADAEAGEPYALEELSAQMRKLAEEVSVHMRRHFNTDTHWRLGLAGGVWEMSKVFQECFEERIASCHPSIELVRSKTASIRGAARLAKETYYGN